MAVRLWQAAVCGLVLAASIAGESDRPVLGPGGHAEGTLSGGERRFHRVGAEPGQALEIAVTEHGIHVEILLQNAAGVDIAGPSERLSAVVENVEGYRVVVHALSDEAPSGGYALDLAPARAAEDADRLRFAAARRRHDGDILLARDTASDTDGAAAAFEDARRLSEQAADLAGQFEAVSMLGEARDQLGDEQGALARYQEALVLARRAGNARGEGAALTWIALAEAHLGIGAEQALEHLRAGLALLRQEGDRAREAEALVTLGFVLNYGEQRDAAADALNEALPLLREFGDYGDLANAENNLGFYLHGLGDGEDALTHYRRAIEIRERHGRQSQNVYTLNNIGYVESELLGRPLDAIQTLERVLALNRDRGDRVSEAYARDGLGAAHLRLGRQRQALADYESALAIWRALGSARGESKVLERIGHVHLVLGEREAAESALRASLEASRRAQAPAVETNALLGLARVALARGDTKEARTRAEAAVQRIESMRAGIARAELRASYFAIVRGAYDLYVDLLMRRGAVEDALLASERSRARTLLETLAGGGPLPAIAVVPDIATVRRALDADTTLVEYALGEERSFAWTLTRDGVAATTLAPRAAIESAARRVAALVAARNAGSGTAPAAWRRRVSEADADLPRAARALARLVLEPLRLTGARRVAIVADGALEYVPFALLPLSDSDTPLLARTEVVRLPSASILATRARPEPVAFDTEVAVLADPVFRSDDPRVTGARGVAAPSPVAALAARSALESGLADLRRLRFSREEAESIAAVVPTTRTRLLLDFAASRDRLGSAAVSGARIVHLATHGVLNARHPEMSGLVLSLVDEHGAARDGFLRVAEVQHLKLDAELVVLSACQTALGKEIRGEGLVGLTRGFLSAGVPQVVATLWRVDDQATAELMKRFYAGLVGRGLPAAAALAEAQRSMRADPRWSAPYYWAAFGAYGDWRRGGRR